METNQEDSAQTTPEADSTSAAACKHHPLLQALPAANSGCKCGKLRPPRKLHAAVGLWLALFVTLHFAICLTGLYPRSYEGTVGQLHRSIANLPGAVLFLILIPMSVQAGSGLYLIAKEGVQYNVKRCDRGGKLRYFLQRWTGLVMLAFLLPHVAIMRGWWQSQSAESGVFARTVSGFHPWTSTLANSITVSLLVVGILVTAFHVANGAWSGAILWKVVKDEQGKARMGYVSLALGITLAAVGCLAWYAFSFSPNVHAALTSVAR
jgi:succinate dehydrogenase / fumarate reductase cytochrome b subunit